MEEPRLPQIEGKVLSVDYGSGDTQYAYIEKPSLEIQAGRLFLTGVPFYYDNLKPVRERFCIAWDSVKSYFIFDSVDHCQESMKNWRDIRKRRQKRKKTQWWRRL